MKIVQFLWLNKGVNFLRGHFLTNQFQWYNYGFIFSFSDFCEVFLPATKSSWLEL